MPEFETGTFTVGTLLGMILGAFLGHALAIRRGKFQVRHNAAIEFRKTIMPAVIDIERGKNAAEIITNTFTSHYEAAREFTAYLQGQKLKKFQLALNEYKSWHKTVCNRTTPQQLNKQEDTEYVEMLRVGPLKNLIKLLKYANT